jgi:hypothetical protein
VRPLASAVVLLGRDLLDRIAPDARPRIGADAFRERGVWSRSRTGSCQIPAVTLNLTAQSDRAPRRYLNVEALVQITPEVEEVHPLSGLSRMEFAAQAAK